jgi:hypothetical protein
LSKQEQRVAIEIRGLFKVIKYFGITFLAGCISSYVATRIFNLDFLILNFHLQNIWLTLPESAIFFGAVWLWNWSRTSEKKKRQKQAKDQLQTWIKEAGGEPQK